MVRKCTPSKTRRSRRPRTKSNFKKTMKTERKPSTAQCDEWVFRFLGNLAAVEKKKGSKKAKKQPKQPKQQPGLKQPITNTRFRSPTPYTWNKNDQAGLPSFSTLADDTYTDSNLDNLKMLISHAQNVDCLSSDLSTDNRVLLKTINRYIQAGLIEGRRRAQRYVRRALSFALETGYLTPVDTSGMVLEISPSLLADIENNQGSENPTPGVTPPGAPIPNTPTGPKLNNSGKTAKKRVTIKSKKKNHCISRRRSSGVRKRRDSCGKKNYRKKNNACTGKLNSSDKKGENDIQSEIGSEVDPGSSKTEQVKKQTCRAVWYCPKEVSLGDERSTCESLEGILDEDRKSSLASAVRANSSSTSTGSRDRRDSRRS